MRNRDIFLIIILTCSLIGLLVLGDNGTTGFLGFLRLVLAFGFVFFFPGYALTTALLPSPLSLTNIQRISISVGLNVVIIALLALILDPLPWGLRTWPLAIGLAASTLLACLVTIWRRRKLDQRLFPQKSFSFKDWWLGESRRQQALFVLIISIIGLASITTLTALIYPQPQASVTEFYIVSPHNVAELYPLRIQPGQSAAIKLGIINHEKRTMHFVIQIRINGELTQSSNSLILMDGQSWESEMSISLPDSPGSYYVELWLLREGESVPYRKLLMNVRVE